MVVSILRSGPEAFRVVQGCPERVVVRALDVHALVDHNARDLLPPPGAHYPRLAEVHFEAFFDGDYLLYINIAWSLVNLLPLWPLDGGQLFELSTAL